MPVTVPFSKYEGKKHNKLTITSDLGFLKGTRIRMVTATCECGTVKEYQLFDVRKYIVKSCGCLPKDHFLCGMCREWKHKEGFPKLSTKNRGCANKCKSCFSEYRKSRYWNNHEVELAKYTKSRTKPENVLQRKEYYEQNKEEYKERYKKYMSDEEKVKQKAETRRKYLENKENLEKTRAQKREYNKRPEVVKRKRADHHIRKKTDIQYVIKRRLRCRLKNAIRRSGVFKFKKPDTMELLGCDFDFFKNYIEDKFTEGMTWDLVLSADIHIDHIKPCAKFDLANIEQQKLCFHYTNLQPLWEQDNLIKRDKYEHQEKR